MKLFFRKLGEGKPLFILHGLFGLSDNWATVGKVLSESFEVYLIDLRNHGSSPHSNEWTYSAMVEDVNELIESTIPQFDKSITLLGHSLGGKVAMQFASMYPEKLGKLIVADIAPKDYPGNQSGFIEKLLSVDLSAMKTRKEAEAQINEIVKDKATVQLLLKNLHWTPHLASPPTPLQGRGESSQILQWRFNLKVIAENQDKIGKTFSIKNRIDTPTLFIRGERSNYIQDSDIQGIKKIFPHSEFKTIEGAGHWVHADKPEEFAEAVKAFAL